MEHGWYWVKYTIGTKWEPCYYGENGWVYEGYLKPSGFWYSVGPKIEEPKE